MEALSPVLNLEATFERELERDRAWLRRFTIGSWVVSLSTVALYLILIMPLGRTSPWLVAMSLYAIATRLLAFLAWKAFLFPRFLLHLDDGDPATVTAARALLERHRSDVLQRILVDHLAPSDPASVAALPAEEVAKLARAYDVEWYRRLGRGCLLAWVLISAAVWTTLIVTGGGPTD
jgi:hypothetical protein